MKYLTWFNAAKSAYFAYPGEKCAIGNVLNFEKQQVTAKMCAKIDGKPDQCYPATLIYTENYNGTLTAKVQSGNYPFKLNNLHKFY
jgi:hypothetical protein